MMLPRDPEWDYDTSPRLSTVPPPSGGERAAARTTHVAWRVPKLPKVTQSSDEEEDEETVVRQGPSSRKVSVYPPHHPGGTMFPPAAGGEDPLHGPAISRGKHGDWYVRLRLREDRIAKLWARKLTPRDVLVWEGATSSWVPLLSVQELRAAIDRERTQAEPRESRSPRQRSGRSRNPWTIPPPKTTAEERPRADESRLAPAVRSVLEGARRATAESVARALPRPPPASSHPPVVVDTPIPEIPVAPRVPDWGEPRDAEQQMLPPPSTAPAESAPAEPAERLEPTPPGLGGWERLFWMAAGVLLVVGMMAGWGVVRGRSSPQQPSTPTATRVAENSPQNSRPADDTAKTEESPESTKDSPRQATEPPEEAPVAAADPSPARTDKARQAAPHPVVRESTESRSAPVQAAAPETPTTPAEAAPTAARVVLEESPSHEQAEPSDLGGFDAMAARRALVSASQRVGYCADGRVSGTAVLTFTPSGIVTNVSLLALKGESVRADCVLRTFQGVRITPFQGGPVTVRKSFRMP